MLEVAFSHLMSLNCAEIPGLDVCISTVKLMVECSTIKPILAEVPPPLTHEYHTITSPDLSFRRPWILPLSY